MTALLQKVDILCQQLTEITNLQCDIWGKIETSSKVSAKCRYSLQRLHGATTHNKIISTNIDLKTLQNRQWTYDVTLRRPHETTFAVEKQYVLHRGREGGK